MKGLFVLIWLLMPINLLAQERVDGWPLDQGQSHIGFSVRVGDRPATGEFTRFSARILFNPEKLSQSRVEVIIDLNHIEASYRDIVKNLKHKDWFDVDRYPKARFISQHFTYLGNRQYQVSGNLTLRDVTRPEIFHFILTEYKDRRAVITGRMDIDRRDYGVGQGSWRETSLVGAKVSLNVVFTAARK